MTGIVHAFFYCYQSTKQFMTTTNPENINKTVVYIQPITHHKHDLLNLLYLTLVLPDRYPRASLRESERESDQCSDRGSFLPHNTFCRAPNKLFPLKGATNLSALVGCLGDEMICSVLSTIHINMQYIAQQMKFAQGIFFLQNDSHSIQNIFLDIMSDCSGD